MLMKVSGKQIMQSLNLKTYLFFIRHGFGSHSMIEENLVFLCQALDQHMKMDMILKFHTIGILRQIKMPYSLPGT